MSDRAFLDSNILVYCVDERDNDKHNLARKIIQSLIDGRNGCISTQTLQEFFNVSTKKLKNDKSMAQSDVGVYSTAFPVHTNTLKDILSAISISIKTQFSFYDSLIIAAAIAEGCSIVYSEDLNDGQTVDGVTIINPFKE